MFFKMSKMMLAVGLLTACQAGDGYVRARVSDVFPITDKDKKLRSMEFILVTDSGSTAKGDIRVDLIKYSNVYDLHGNSQDRSEAGKPLITKKDASDHLALSTNNKGDNRDNELKVYSSLKNNSAFLYGVELDNVTPPPGIYVIKLTTALEEVRSSPIIYSPEGRWRFRMLDDENVQGQQKPQDSTMGTTTKLKPAKTSAQIKKN